MDTLAHVLQYCIVEDTRVRGMTAAVVKRRMHPFYCIRHNKNNYILYPVIHPLRGMLSDMLHIFCVMGSLWESLPRQVVATT